MFSAPDTTAQLVPQMLNGIEIWGLTGPRQNLDFFGLQPLSDALRLVFWIIIHLIHPFATVFFVVKWKWHLWGCHGIELSPFSRRLEQADPLPMTWSTHTPSHFRPRASPVILVNLGSNFLPTGRLTYRLPSLPNRQNFDSSDQTTLDQFFASQSLCAFANSSLALLFFSLTHGFLHATLPLRPTVFRRLDTVCLLTLKLYSCSISCEISEEVLNGSAFDLRLINKSMLESVFWVDRFCEDQKTLSDL